MHPGIFQSSGVFFKLTHFGQNYIYKTKKGSAGKKIVFFSHGNLNHRWPQPGYIFPKSGHFFPIFEKWKGNRLSPPSSYVPDLTCHYSYCHIYFPFVKTLCRNIGNPLLKWWIYCLQHPMYVSIIFKWNSQFLETCFCLFWFHEIILKSSSLYVFIV